MSCEEDCCMVMLGSVHECVLVPECPQRVTSIIVWENGQAMISAQHRTDVKSER